MGPSVLFETPERDISLRERNKSFSDFKLVDQRVQFEFGGSAWSCVNVSGGISTATVSVVVSLPSLLSCFQSQLVRNSQPDSEMFDCGQAGQILHK